MEKLFQEIYSQDTKFQVIGQSNQILQILLMPEESLNTKSNNVQYFTENINSVPANKRNAVMRFLTMQEDEIRLTNNSKHMGCVGLSRNYGKVLTLDILVLESFWVRESSIIAMSSRLELHISLPAFGVGAFKRVSLNHDISQTQLVFLQSSGTLIEKELGAGETFNVRYDSIVAFSDRLNFSVKKNIKFVNVTGPGRIYFEGVSRTNTMAQVHQRMTLLMGLLFLVMFTWGLLLEIIVEEMI